MAGRGRAPDFLNFISGTPEPSETGLVNFCFSLEQARKKGGPVTGPALFCLSC